MQVEPVGHIIVFGGTFTGKTYFCKWFIDTLKPLKTFVFAGEKYEWSDYNVQDGDFSESVEKIIKECDTHMDELRKEPTFKPITPFILVFDDYNEEINTRSNDFYKQLYTRGRHHGIRVINLAHTAKAIGPTARGNARYIFMSCKMPEPEIKEIADMFYNKDHIKLTKIAHDALQQNEYNFIIIDRHTKRIDVRCAPEIQLNTRSQTHEIDIPSNSAINTHTADSYYNNLGGMSIANKSAYNMYDNSRNNFNIDYRIKNDQKIQSNHINNKLKFQNVHVENKINLYQNMNDAVDIIYKPWKTPEEVQKLVYVLNRTLRPDPPYTIHDYEEGIDEYLKVYFKNNHYTKHKSDTARLTEYAGNIFMGRDNPLALVSNIGNFIQYATRK